MYKMIIVDDEPLILSGLKTLIEWEVYGIEIVCDADDGMSAYVKIKEFHPDIALIDISMPNMNGLELIELCSHLNQPPKFIILSGYSDFEYVRTALQHGAVNYLLKPVDQEELCSTIESTVKMLDDISIKTQQFQESLSALRNDVLIRLLHGRIEARELREKCRLLGLSFHSASMCVGLIKSLDNDTGSDHPFFTFSDIELCEQTCGKSCPAYAAIDITGYMLLIFKNDIHDQIPKDYHSLLELCAESMSAQTGRKFLTSLGPAASCSAELSVSYDSALKVLEKHPEKNHSADYSPTIQYVLTYLQDNYDDPNLSLKTLAGQMNVNAAYLGRQFSLETQKYFSDYLNQVRISHAIQLMDETTWKTSDIAKAVGFFNASYFFTIFKKVTGVRPGDYRKSTIRHTWINKQNSEYSLAVCPSHLVHFPYALPKP